MSQRSLFHFANNILYSIFPVHIVPKHHIFRIAQNQAIPFAHLHQPEHILHKPEPLRQASLLNIVCKGFAFAVVHLPDAELEQDLVVDEAHFVDCGHCGENVFVRQLVSVEVFGGLEVGQVGLEGEVLVVELVAVVVSTFEEGR
jgi:hypothetical protein